MSQRPATARCLLLAGLFAVAPGSASPNAGRLPPDSRTPDSRTPNSFIAVVSRPPLQPLPTLELRALPQPTAEQLKRLDAWMLQLHSPDKAISFSARARIAHLDGQLLPSITKRLKSLALTSNKPQFKALLTEVRRLARVKLRHQLQASGRQGSVVTPDYLEMLLDYRGPASEHLAPLIELLACSRMLESLGSTPATLQLIDIYVRFGEFLRVDTQLSLTRLGRRSISALLLTTRHPAPKIAHWAEQRLQAGGFSTPSEAIVGLPETLLPELLRAYGSVRSLPSVRLLLSYARHENQAIRLAARQAITHIGKASLWQLRDAYERTLAERAPATWAWERLAAELFAQYDQLRLSTLYELFAQGRSAAAKQDWKRAVEAFDQLLALDPQFEGSQQTLTSYWNYAQQAVSTNAAQANLALRRIERLADPSTLLAKQATSLRYTLDAQHHWDNGWADRVQVLRALKLDPTNQRAQRLLVQLRSPKTPGRKNWLLYLPTGLVALLTLLALSIQLLTHRQRQLAGGDSQ